MRIGIIGLLALLSINSFGQSEADQDWKSKDFNTDGIPGISLDAAYKQFVDGKTGEEIVVAVIDSGVEVDHDDLKDKIWINEDEIPDNGIDDDNNGYVDDVHGWNFIGGPGGDVEFDNLEFTRIYKKLKDRFEGKDKASISSEDKEDFARYLKMSEQFDARLGSAEENLKEFKAIKQVFRMSKKTMKEVLNGDEYTVENLEALPKGDERFEALRGLAIEDLKNDVSKDIDEAIDHFKNQTKYSYNLKLDTREMVGDDYDDLSVTNYGNNHYEGPRARHGTHVAGIIAGVRDNGIGMQGVANNAKIMVLRVVPDGDERDKDVANAIRYAADNGAKIINMSFGKSYSPQKTYVDEAVWYAESKGVLMVHAAGNSSKNNDKSNNFPNSVNEITRERCKTWIEVGANSWKGEMDVPATF
ncbi:MAG: S8 family serine peptidase, partial [Flavobacteriales bacterium]|nr:S8 family serine peptidase [Flavobacteriales bacterium]